MRQRTVRFSISSLIYAASVPRTAGFGSPRSIFIRVAEMMEAVQSGPGLPKWNGIHYSMVCFFSVGLHACVSLPYYLVKYSGEW